MKALLSAAPRRPRPAFFLHGQFALLWTGQTISAFGSHISGLGLPVIAVLLLHATPAQLGLLAALGALPGAGLGLLIGVWVDRLPRRLLMLAADLGRALLLALLPVLALAGLLHFTWLALIAALSGVLAVVFEVACLSFLPTLLKPDELLPGNSRLATSAALAEIAGPPLAALFIQVLSAPLAILLDACSFLCSAGCLCLLRQPEQLPGGERASIVRQLARGPGYVLSHPLLRPLAAYTCTQNFCGGAFAALYLIYTWHLLGASPLAYGLLVACGGLGAFVGSWAAARCLRRLGRGRTLIAATLLSGGLAFCTPLAAGPRPLVFALLALAQLLADAGFAVYAIGEISLRQQLVPGPLLGRTNACMHMLSAAALPLGALLAGLLSEFIGVRLTLLAGSTGLLLAVAWLLFSPVRHLP
ncbi:MAG TPA: MFS transporter [Ktedonobacteraceae bacterium]